MPSGLASFDLLDGLLGRQVDLVDASSPADRDRQNEVHRAAVDHLQRIDGLAQTLGHLLTT